MEVFYHHHERTLGRQSQEQRSQTIAGLLPALFRTELIPRTVRRLFVDEGSQCRDGRELFGIHGREPSCEAIDEIFINRA